MPRKVYQLNPENPILKAAEDLVDNGKVKSIFEAFDEVTVQHSELTPDLKPHCLFGYWRKVKGEYDQTCNPQVRYPDLKERNQLKELRECCKQCDMKQKALIRYRAVVVKNNREREHEPDLKFDEDKYNRSEALRRQKQNKYGGEPNRGWGTEK